MMFIIASLINSVLFPIKCFFGVHHSSDNTRSTPAMKLALKSHLRSAVGGMLLFIVGERYDV
jgi:hypothetical protein